VSLESEIEVREQICGSARRVYEKNYLASCDGNISYRITDECILITPTGVSKGFLTPDQIAIVDLHGNVVRGQPSGEVKMHLQVYRSSTKARAVVHAHPPFAVAWSVARPDLKELPANSLSEVILAAGSIPIVPYARPGTQEMGDRLVEFLPAHRALILARHGALSWGESLEEATNGMERIDHSAQILFLAHQLGGLTELPSDEVNHLKLMREKLGERLL
jgi:L-fuculose-phosphate aldolase